MKLYILVLDNMNFELILITSLNSVGYDLLAFAQTNLLFMHDNIRTYSLLCSWSRSIHYHLLFLIFIILFPTSLQIVLCRVVILNISTPSFSRTIVLLLSALRFTKILRSEKVKTYKKK